LTLGMRHVYQCRMTSFMDAMIIVAIVAFFALIIIYLLTLLTGC
jgi:hypothetical protein